MNGNTLNCEKLIIHLISGMGIDALAILPLKSYDYGYCLLIWRSQLTHDRAVGRFQDEITTTKKHINVQELSR